MQAFVIFLVFIPLFVLAAVYAERKISAFIQDRLGPLETGRYGLLQTPADIIKLLQKEDIIPATADRFLFAFAPVMIFAAIFAGFAVLPFSPNLTGTQTDTGLLYVLAIVSLDVMGILMAGWASGSKFSLLGAMRSVAQMISYEVPLGLSVLVVVLFCGSLDLSELSRMQSAGSFTAVWLFDIRALELNVADVGGVLTWNIVRYPLLLPAWVVFFIASLAECNRAPFDIPEAESELVGGYHTEYSGIRFAFIFLSEYAMMLLVSLLGTVLFFGSWNTPLPNIGNLRLADYTGGGFTGLSANLWGGFWLLSKTFLLVVLQMWIRWTWPRVRTDRLMGFCWKILTPLSFLLIVLALIWKIF